MSQKYVGGKTNQCLYTLLQISQESNIKEIKLAYKKLALRLHPDRNEGCPKKTQQFKDVSEAYAVLSNDASRRQYDLQNGHRYNKNRRNPPPKNYRKVYAPVPPPNMKRTFDHTRHYEMHYGKGMMDEAMDNIRREAKRNGEPDPNAYQSPLGNGFTFDANAGVNESMNPYARRNRYRQKQTVWEYEEGSNMGGSGRVNITRRAEVVEDVNGMRRQRKAREEEKRRKEEEASKSAFQPQEEACIIQ